MSTCPPLGSPPNPRDITLSISLAPVASASSFLLLLPSVLKHDHISPVLKKINPPSLPSPSCFFLDPVLSHSSQFSIYISSNPVLPVHTITLHTYSIPTAPKNPSFPDHHCIMLMDNLGYSKCGPLPLIHSLGGGRDKWSLPCTCTTMFLLRTKWYK